MKNFIKLLTLFAFTSNIMLAQKFDTILITPKNLKINQLKESNSQYLVYILNDKNSPKSSVQIWNIEVKKENYNGKRAIAIYQKWDGKDTIIHTAKSISLAENFKPLYHESWWSKRGKQVFDEENKKLWINNLETNSNEVDAKKKAVYTSFTSAKDYFLNWHLDLEVFRMLPYKKNTTFLIPFYEFGYSKPQNFPYTVIAEDDLVFNEKIIKCWLLKHEEKGNKELFWVSKSTNEVIKMEQLINDKIYRYKLKLIN